MSERQAEYITISQAAAESGYRSPTSLRAAAREGRLKTIRSGPRVQLTTREWLAEFLGRPRDRRGARPGVERPGRRKGAAGGEDVRGDHGG